MKKTPIYAILTLFTISQALADPPEGSAPQTMNPNLWYCKIVMQSNIDVNGACPAPSFQHPSFNTIVVAQNSIYDGFALRSCSGNQATHLRADFSHSENRRPLLEIAVMTHQGPSIRFAAQDSRRPHFFQTFDPGAPEGSNLTFNHESAAIVCVKGGRNLPSIPPGQYQTGDGNFHIDQKPTR